MFVVFLAGLTFAERESYCTYDGNPSKTSIGNMNWIYAENNCIYSIEQCYWTLLVQAVAWMVAAVYLDNVQPNKHGVKLPLWYPLLPGYWANMFRAAAAAVSRRQSSTGGNAAQGKSRQKTPFATSDVNRKVAKSITQAQQEELVIRCSSSPGGVPDQPKGANAAAVGPNGSIHRHSVSSGFLRRRDHRQSSGGDQAPAVDLGNRGVSTLGKLPHFQQNSVQNSQQLNVQSSVTVLRLSDTSSEAHSGVVGTVGIAAGSTISLQQYQQMQQAKQASSAAARRWWEFWRVPESSLVLASKKHGSMVSAAAAAAPGNLQGKELPDSAYGMVPVVLDPGVLQEEQRMKAVWYTGMHSRLLYCMQLQTINTLQCITYTSLGRSGSHLWLTTGFQAANERLIGISG